MLITICFITIVFSSCDSENSSYSYKINNTSDYSFNVVSKIQGKWTKDTIFVVNPSESLDLYKTELLKDEDLGDRFLSFFDTLYVFPVDSTIKLNKVINSRKNWTFEVKSHKKSSDCLYEFTITNEDIKISD